jgi:autotransporter passenger strand-loop-strand repeat protein
MTTYIVSSGTTSGITVGNGSVMSVFDTGIAQAITVTSGGVMSAYDGGVTSGAHLSASPSKDGRPALEYVYSGGASYETVIHGATEVVSGGKAYDTRVDNYSNLDVYNGGLAVNSIVGRYSDLTVKDAIVSATTLGSTGQLFVSAGGIAIDTMVNAEGGDSIYSSGTASGTQLLSGNEVVFSGGVAYRTTVNDSSGQFVEGGIASRTTVNNGGFQTVNAGTAVDTVVNGGGIEYVNGTTKDTRLNGGTLILENGARAESAIKFTSTGGEMIINSTKMPNNAISGFTSGDDSVSVNAPNVVTVSAGGTEYDLKIKGAVVGETDFVFGSGSILTKTATSQMDFLRAAVTQSAGLDASIFSAVALTISDFAPKIAGGGEYVVSATSPGAFHTQELALTQMLIPVSMTQAL